MLLLRVSLAPHQFPQLCYVATHEWWNKVKIGPTILFPPLITSHVVSCENWCGARLPILLILTKVTLVVGKCDCDVDVVPPIHSQLEDSTIV